MTDEPTIHEHEVELYTVQVHGACPREGCGGELRGTGMGMTRGDGSWWENSCTTCHQHVSLRHSYPYIAHRPRPLKARSEDGNDG